MNRSNGFDNLRVGNARKYYRLNDAFVCFIGVRTVNVPVSDFVSRIKELSLAGMIIQSINSRAAYGIGHLLGVLKITIECQKRNITISTKPEIDLLLRLSLTSQINFALNHAGLNPSYPAIIIFYSKDKKKVAGVRKKIVKTIPNVDNTVLKISKESRDHIFRIFKAKERTRISLRDDSFITQYLIERSALVMK
jgi:tRNA threonylcarbamoyladenosine modification (KEOPS) complex Cgi121 subunit